MHRLHEAKEHEIICPWSLQFYDESYGGQDLAEEPQETNHAAQLAPRWPRPPHSEHIILPVPPQPAWMATHLGIRIHLMNKSVKQLPGRFSFRCIPWIYSRKDDPITTWMCHVYRRGASFRTLNGFHHMEECLEQVLKHTFDLIIWKDVFNKTLWELDDKRVRTWLNIISYCAFDRRHSPMRKHYSTRNTASSSGHFSMSKASQNSYKLYIAKMNIKNISQHYGKISLEIARAVHLDKVRKEKWEWKLKSFLNISYFFFSQIQIPSHSHTSLLSQN